MVNTPSLFFFFCEQVTKVHNLVLMLQFHFSLSQIKVILYHGHPDEREKKRRQIRKHFGEFKTQPVVVTSYEIVMIDRKHLANHLWKYIIVDEGHRIKNLNCRLIRSVHTTLFELGVTSF